MARMGNMISKEIKSAYLDETIKIKVFIPKNFNSLYPNQICYMQDGDDYYQMGRVATVSDRLHEEEVLVNTTFVGIHYIDRKDRQKKYHPNGEQFFQYQQFLIKEVIPIVDELLPLNPLGKAQTLIGDSLAGTFALLTALSYPTVFTQVIMQSPLVDDAVIQTVHEEKENIHRLSYYHSIGLKETAVWTSLGDELDFVEPNQRLAQLLQKDSTNYKYETISEGNHTWKYWQRELPEVLEHMLG